MAAAPLPLRTVGHGTLAADELLALLSADGVEVVVDVRAFPGSRRHPQHGRDAMAGWLAAGGVGYRWEGADLGGRRRGVDGSPHTALRNESFRAYADHMATPAFAAGLGRVLALAAERPTTVLCSEAVWWRCHRRLVADAATLLHGVEVVHLMHDGRRPAHVPTDGVRREGGRLVYDGGQAPLPT